MADLVVRAYNVRFGDAILVEVPDRDPATGQESLRRILIDVGNVLNAEGGDDTVFKPVVDDVLARLAGAPLDLYVMTHEHLDHVQGLPFVAGDSYPNGELAQRLAASYAWLTASAAEDYYTHHPDAKEKSARLRAAYVVIERALQLRPVIMSDALGAMLANNNYRQTDPCVAYLRSIAPKKRTKYVYRGMKGKLHPFREAKLKIWAPEEDTSTYYGPFQPLTMGLEATAAAGPAAAVRELPVPPSGVDAGAFYDLVEARTGAIGDNLLAIDQAANNTSVVFSLEWRGWRLLFTGDAEVRSWREMAKRAVLKPVHFLKVGHHSSHNGTPDGELFDTILPPNPPDDRPRKALISTWENTYSGIPHDATIERLRSRCEEVVSTLEHRDELFVEMRFPG